MNMKRTAAVLLSALTVISAAGCEQVRDFSADSIQSLGSQVSDAAGMIGDALGFPAVDAATPVPTQTARVYEAAGPKPTLTEAEAAAEKAKREEILRGVDSYFSGRITAAPAAAGDGAAAQGEADAGTGKDRKNGEKGRDKADVTPTAKPSPTEKPSATPTEKPEATPTEMPEAAPTEMPKATPVPDDALLDW